MRIRRKIAGGLMAGLVAGVFLGFVGRIVMRILALAGNMIPTFTIEASLGVLLIGVIIGLVSGLIYAVLKAVLKAFLPPFRGQGVVFGLIIMGVLLLLMPDLIQGELANAENGQRVLRLAAGLYAVVFSAFGAIVEAVSMRMGKIAPSLSLE